MPQQSHMLARISVHVGERGAWTALSWGGGGGGGCQQSSDPVRSQQLFYGLDSVLVAYFQYKGERCLFQVELSLRVTAHR